MKVTLGLGEAHRIALNHAYAGTMTASDRALLGDIAGAVNQAFDAATAPPIPPPDPSDPLARMRLAPGQLSMWAGSVTTSPEMDAMRAIHGGNRVSEQVGFYGPGSVGNVYVKQTGPASYKFLRIVDEQGNRYPNDAQVTADDVNGAGDAYVALLAQMSGNPVIGRLDP